jgi:hypothetical protein
MTDRKPRLTENRVADLMAELGALGARVAALEQRVDPAQIVAEEFGKASLRALQRIPQTQPGSLPARRKDSL